MQRLFSEIISHVMTTETPPFRPQVDRALCSVELYSLMERCWSEDPKDRPSFKDVRTEMQHISKSVAMHYL